MEFKSSVWKEDDGWYVELHYKTRNGGGGGIYGPIKTREKTRNFVKMQRRNQQALDLVIIEPLTAQTMQNLFKSLQK